MNSYNGFDGAQRLRALAWVKKQRAQGLRGEPQVCDACGQTKGVKGHSEDYSEPFGPHIGEYGLCYTCHMMVHCRFKNPLAWRAYCDAVAAGATFPANLSRNFRAFCATFLVRKFPEPEATRPPPARLALQEIEDGLALKRRGPPAQGQLL